MEKDLVIEELRRSTDEIKNSYEKKLDAMLTELKSTKALVGSLRRNLVEAELCYAKQVQFF